MNRHAPLPHYHLSRIRFACGPKLHQPPAIANPEPSSNRYGNALAEVVAGTQRK